MAGDAVDPQAPSQHEPSTRDQKSVVLSADAAALIADVDQYLQHAGACASRRLMEPQPDWLDIGEYACGVCDCKRQQLLDLVLALSGRVEQLQAVNAELLAALKDVSESLASTRDCELGNDPDGWESVQRARTAIAKADSFPTPPAEARR